jgi:Sec7-like guanine-nucleotide exchange factor
MKDKTAKIEALRLKQEQIKARIQKLESLEKLQQRKQDTRRKILIGAYFLDKANQSGSLDKLYQELESYITRPMDKDLFKMPELDAVEG